MQAGFAAMVFSAKARKSDSDTYPGRPSILLSDSQLYTPGRLENLRNHFPMGVPCLTLLLELFSELSLVFICSSEPSALQNSTASIVLPQQLADIVFDRHQQGVPGHYFIGQIILEPGYPGSEDRFCHRIRMCPGAIPGSDRGPVVISGQVCSHPLFHVAG